MDVRTVPEMVADYRLGDVMGESLLCSVELLALFDQDYEDYLLVQEWHYFAPERGWVFSLWYRSFQGPPECLHEWESRRRIPFAEAGALVEEHIGRRLEE